MFASGVFPEVPGPEPLEAYVVDVEVDGTGVELVLFDTSAMLNDLGRTMRLLSYYSHSHVVMICFGIDSPYSLENVEEKWAGEIRHFCPKVPYILIGLRRNFRDDPYAIDHLKKANEHPVTWEEAHAVSRRIGAAAYFETSADNNKGVREIFETAARLALTVPPKRKNHGRFRSLLNVFGVSQK